MQVYALKIEEILGTSGAVETQIVVEAETIFDVPANGIYYANLVVIGVPDHSADEMETPPNSYLEP